MRIILALLFVAFGFSVPAFSVGVQMRLGAHSPLAASGPVTVTANGQTVSNLDITANCTAVEVGGFDNVTIQNVRIAKNVSCGTGDAFGINASGADNLRVRNVEIIDAGMPDQGAGPAANAKLCVQVIGGSNLEVDALTVRDCSTGIFMQGVTGTALSNIESHNMRGPFPRGMAVQWVSGFGTNSLTSASDEPIPGTSWNEDSFSVYATPNVTITDLFLPFTSDSPTGRGLVAEQIATINFTLNNMQVLNYFNGAYGAFEQSGATLDGKVRGGNVYSVRGLPGSSISGSVLGAQVVTCCNPTPGVYASVTGLWDVLPTVTANGTAVTPGIRNTWSNPTGEGTGTVSAGVWTQTLAPIRNPFPWRDMSATPAANLSVRIGSYWLDGVFGTSLVNGAVLAVLPGVYDNDPTIYAWQWTKNGSPIIGQTFMYLPLSGMISGDVLCVEETVANDNGSAGPFQACVGFP